MILLAFVAFFSIAFASESYKIYGKSTGVEIDLLKQSFDAKGISEVFYDDINISAKKITKDPKANKIIAEKNIKYIQGKYRVIANYLDLDLDKKISNVKKGRTELNKFYLQAENIEIKFPDILIAKDAYVTTCNLEHPHFRIKAKHVDFYPDSKFVAYQGWIYIGEHFRLFPVPIYASYVVDKEDKAPLFPKITYDPAKGMMVIYGFDYQFFKDETVWGIPNVNLGILFNLEYSANRGFGINKLKTKYSIMKNKNFNGEIEIKDWVNAGKESKDSNLALTQSVNLNPNPKAYGSSYKFSTKNELKIDDGYLFKLRDSYILGPSNSMLEIKVTDSDLIKDSKGNYDVEATKSKFSQFNIQVDQKVWKLLNVKYKFLNIQTDKEVLNNLFAKADDKLEDSVDEQKQKIDTKLENQITLIHEDPKYHRFQFEYKRNSDLRPDKYNSGKSKYDNKDLYDVNFKHLKLRATKEYSYKDIWASQTYQLKEGKEKENYVAEEFTNNNLSFELGEYHIFNTNFTHKYSVRRTDQNHQFFDVPLVKMDGDEIYNSRANRLYKEDKEIYTSGRIGLGHRGIDIYKVLTIIPGYDVEFKKYDSPDKTFVSYNQYFDTVGHFMSLRTAIKIYNNLSEPTRKVDLDIKFTPEASISLVLGESPKGQIKPLNKSKYSAGLDAVIGNIKNNYSFTWNRDVDSKDKFVKLSQFINSGSIKLNSQELFAVRIDKREQWEIANSAPDSSLEQSYGTDLEYVKLKFQTRSAKSYTRDYKDKNIINFENDKTSYGGSIYCLGLTTTYEYSLNKRYDVLKERESSNLVENKFELKYSKDFKEQKRKYEALFSYQNEYDQITLKFKDSKLACSFLFEDRNFIKTEEFIEEYSNEEVNETKESSFFDFNKVEDAEIDRILGIFTQEKPKKNIMDLGSDEKKTSLNDRLIKFSAGIKISHDAGRLAELGDFSWANYQASWKKTVFDTFFKFSRYLEIGFKINKGRTDITQDFKEDTRELSIKLGFGREGYEWWPGFYMKENIADKENKANSVTESIYGTIDHNMHCTKMRMKLGKSRGINKEMVWTFGFEISITEFPEKAFGMDIKEDAVENVKFGL